MEKQPEGKATPDKFICEAPFQQKGNLKHFIYFRWSVFTDSLAAVENKCFYC